MIHIRPHRKSITFLLFWAILTWMGMTLACSSSGATPDRIWKAPDSDLAKTALARAATQTPVAQFTQTPVIPVASPTPDPPRVLPTLRSQTEEYIVQPGDNLAMIAQRYNLTVDLLVEANNIANPNYFEGGQLLVIPA